MKNTAKKNSQSFLIRHALFMLSILMCLGILHATLEQQIPTTTTNTMGMQYLAPYRKELKKFDTAIQSIEEFLQNNPAAATTQAGQLAELYQTRHALIRHIVYHEILFTRFALNELMRQESFTHLFDFQDYEHNLYVVCGPFDKEKDTYKPNEHLLHHLAQHTHLKSGYVKWAKTLAMPTTDISQLKRTQEVSKELLRNTELREQLEVHLKQIKDQGLEDSFLSFWKDESVMQVVSNAPYATNSSFAPVIELLFTLKKMKDGDIASLQEAIGQLDKSTAFIGTVNLTTFIQDVGLILIGVNMVSNGWHDLKTAVTSLPIDMSYLGGWKVMTMPIILPVIRLIINKIIDFSLKKRMQKEYETLTTLCEQNKQAMPQSSTITVGKIELAYDTEQQAHDAQILVNQHMPYCQVMLNEKNLVVTLTAQEERAFRFSHPLMQHETLITIVIPCVLYLLICYLGFGIPLLSWGSIGIIPFTHMPLPVPGFALLPWHAIKALTSIGLIPAYAYQHFWKTPQKSMLSTTHSIQLARKALLDFAQLINHVKQIQTLLVNNPVLRENLHEIEELDAEKVVQERIAFAKTILQQNDDFLQRNGMSKNDLAKAIAHLETTHRELSTLLDTLQAHVNETESTEPHSWLSPTGFVKNLKIRFGSDDLLAAYKIIQSIKDTFAPWIEALGEIDRKVSEVNLMREFEAKNVTFCFAEYEPQGTPHLAATGLWLPHLLSKMPPEKIVTNDLEMGQDGLASTIIVSGPTEGGKSTILRTAACAALMAQTVGFVPATRWIATPLDRVLLSFNAADNLGKTVTKTAAADTQTGTSGFRDEVESIKHIVQEMSKLTPGQHALIIIDELFQKVQRSGEYFSEQVIRQNFIAANNTLSVIVSHREQPKYLERETAGRCKNYHFVLRQDGDKLVNTYRIEPGALFRPEHKVVTLQEIMRNQEDAYNLQMTQEAGILMGPLTQPSIRMRTGHSPSTPREALETSPLTAPV